MPRPSLVAAAGPAGASAGGMEHRPGLDPATAETGPEPMATLSRYRQFETGVLFGMHAVVGGAGRNTVLSVGDHVEALLDI